MPGVPRGDHCDGTVTLASGRIVPDMPLNDDSAPVGARLRVVTDGYFAWRPGSYDWVEQAVFGMAALAVALTLGMKTIRAALRKRRTADQG